MRQLNSFIAKALLTMVVGGGILATASAEAQSRNGATATIPFEFSAQRASLGAGEYEIKSLPDPFLLAIRKAGIGRDSIVTIRKEDSQFIPSHGYLVFRGGSGHFHLAEIHVPGTHSYSVIIQKRMPEDNDIKIALNQ